MKLISKEQIDWLPRWDRHRNRDPRGEFVSYDVLRAVYDNAPSVLCNKEAAITELWECIGRWSAYLASNGGQANSSPPQWLMDAVKNATAGRQPNRVAELEAKLKEYEADAKRYQWLVNTCIDYESLSEGDAFNVKSIYFEYSPKMLISEAIDQAMKGYPNDAE